MIDLLSEGEAGRAAPAPAVPPAQGKIPPTPPSAESKVRFQT